MLSKWRGLLLARHLMEISAIFKYSQVVQVLLNQEVVANHHPVQDDAQQGANEYEETPAGTRFVIVFHGFYHHESSSN
jgi:hypothetical protein